MANVARSVFMQRASGSPSNTVNVLVTFGRMFSKINASSKHSPNISVPLIKSFLHNGIYKRRSMKKHSFIALIVIFFGNFSSSMRITFPKFDISDFLDLDYIVATKNASGVTLITMFSNCGLHFFFDGGKFRIVAIYID